MDPSEQGTPFDRLEMVGDSLEDWHEKGRLAKLVSERAKAFWTALRLSKPGGPPVFPLAEFRSLLGAIRNYDEATMGDPLVHRIAACAVSGLVQSIRLAGLTAPEKDLEEASRLQLWFNRGIDPQLIERVEHFKPPAG